uniref:Uncharacterized protein n=1 Tax=Glossina palpalis gambiensis TaxID=67801 RepID=A0A1B0AW70_9MUSC
MIAFRNWEDVEDVEHYDFGLFIQLNFTPMFFVLQLLNAVVVTQAFQIVFQNLITQSIGSFKSFAVFHCECRAIYKLNFQNYCIGSTIICNNQRNNKH